VALCIDCGKQRQARRDELCDKCRTKQNSQWIKADWLASGDYYEIDDEWRDGWLERAVERREAKDYYQRGPRRGRLRDGRSGSPDVKEAPDAHAD